MAIRTFEKATIKDYEGKMRTSGASVAQVKRNVYGRAGLEFSESLKSFIMWKDSTSKRTEGAILYIDLAITYGDLNSLSLTAAN